MPFYSDRGLLPYQADGVARVMTQGGAIARWDTGLGKSILSLVLAAYNLDEVLVDRVLVVCEPTKMPEWQAEFLKFTGLVPVRYHGPQRAKRLANQDDRVLLSTYETVRQDAAVRRPNKPRALDDGPLTTALLGQRVMVIYDETSAKMRNRKNKLYRHHEHMLNRLRKFHPQIVVALTATLIERDPETAFNVARLVSPHTMGTVEQFEKDHVGDRNLNYEVIRWKNIGLDDWDGITPTLRTKLDPILLIKSKDDPDVRDLFPEGVEEYTMVEMAPEQRELYDAFDRLMDSMPDSEAINGPGFMVARQIAGIPEALTLSQGYWARTLTAHVGADRLRAMGSPKLDRLEQWATTVAAQDAQMVIFTFFGPSMIPIIHRRLVEAGLSVAVSYPALGAQAREQAYTTFRAGGAQIFLSSDANSRGINLPEASYTANFELPLLHSTYMQRLGRTSRIYSPHDVVFVQSFVTAVSIEEAIAQGVLKRNVWDDAFGDFSIDENEGGKLTAQQRRLLIREARALVSGGTR